MVTKASDTIVYPCDYPLKIFGWHNDAFMDKVLAILQRHIPNLTEDMIKVTKSKAANYLSITVKFTATSQAQVDALYRELSASPEILMTL